MVKTIRIAGNILLCAGALLILVGSATVLVTKGIGAFMELFNPFNITNFIAMLIVLAPGIVLRILAENIENKHKPDTSE